MPFNWNQYIDYGRELSESNKEVELRVSVSRGYYGAYHLSRRKVGFSSDNYIPHKDLINSLRENKDIPKARRIASVLEHLKEIRVNADYKSFHELKKRDSIQFWKRLDQLIEYWNVEE